MYGAHHRVAPLRRGGHVATPNATQPTPHTQRGAAPGPFTLPAAMAGSRLAAPSASQLPQNSQMSAAAPFTQAQVGDGAGAQATSRPKETAAALCSVAESLRQQERHMAAGCQRLAHLSAIADGQHAQAAALHELAGEIRGMVGVIKDAVEVLLKLPGAERRTTLPSGARSFDEGRSRESSAELVLGADSSFLLPCTGDDAKEAGEGAAYVQSSRLKDVVLKGAGSRTRCATSNFLTEDDVFSM